MKIENLNGMTEEEKIDKLIDWISQLNLYSMYETGLPYLTIFDNEEITLFITGERIKNKILIYDRKNSAVWNVFIFDLYDRIKKWKLSVDDIWNYVQKHCMPIINEVENKFKIYLDDVDFFKLMNLKGFLKEIRKQRCVLFKNEQIIIGISDLYIFELKKLNSNNKRSDIKNLIQEESINLRLSDFSCHSWNFLFFTLLYDYHIWPSQVREYFENRYKSSYKKFTNKKISVEDDISELLIWLRELLGEEFDEHYRTTFNFPIDLGYLNWKSELIIISESFSSKTIEKLEDKCIDFEILNRYPNNTIKYLLVFSEDVAYVGDDADWVFTYIMANVIELGLFSKIYSGKFIKEYIFKDKPVLEIGLKLDFQEHSIKMIRFEKIINRYLLPTYPLPQVKDWVWTGYTPELPFLNKNWVSIDPKILESINEKNQK